MKKLILLSFLSMVTLMAMAGQTLWVATGQVRYAFDAKQVGKMPHTSDGELTVQGKSFDINCIDSIYVTSVAVADNTVDVNYTGSVATVIIAGNIARNMTASVNGAHVAVMQDAEVETEIFYNLSGSTTNGSFYQDGSYKISLKLNGLTLTNPDSAAVNIRDGKRIAIELADGTVNTLADGTGGDWKGCFMVKGHSEFKGAGTLNLKGNTGHAFWGKEYVELKKTVGTINITGAVGDGMNINQYFLQKGGKVIIANVGDDGIQVSKTDDADDEDNGMVTIAAGSLDITTTATASKGLKAESDINITGGNITIKTTGNGMWNTEKSETQACAAIKGDANITIGGDAVLSLTSTGSGGKGISCDSVFTLNGGNVTVSTSGAQYTYGTSIWQQNTTSNKRSSAKGVKGDTGVVINDGTLKITTTGSGAEGIESKNTLDINGGTVEVDAYDDGINSTRDMTINGGNVYVNSTANDGLDSNHNLFIKGGLLMVYGSGAPECGLDAIDDESRDPGYVYVTGGTLVAVGSGTSYPHSLSGTTMQPVYVYGGSLSQGASLAINDSNGSNVLAFTMTKTLQQGGRMAPGGPGGPGGGSGVTVVISSPKIVSGQTYTIYTGSTLNASATNWHSLYHDGTAVKTNGTSAGSATAKTPYVSVGNSGGRM